MTSAIPPPCARAPTDPDRTFVAQRPPHRRATVLLDGEPIDWPGSLALRNHSPTGIEWGYAGSAPSQLALTMLLAVVDEHTALALYQRYKFQAVAHMPREWDLGVASVADWVRAQDGAAGTRAAREQIMTG